MREKPVRRTSPPAGYTNWLDAEFVQETLAQLPWYHRLALLSFGNPVVPREGFLVPLFVIEEMVEKIKDGTIRQYIYDTKSAALIERNIHADGRGSGGDQ